MEIDDVILEIVATAPNHQIEGKKRLHKTLYLLQLCGAHVPAKFYIKHFGVFSDEVAVALDFLSAFELLKTQTVQVSPTGYFSTVFCSSKPDEEVGTPLLHKRLKRLGRESTSVLEVASTIAFFEESGLSGKQAERATKEMKPLITNDKNVTRARALLADLQHAVA